MTFNDDLHRLDRKGLIALISLSELLWGKYGFESKFKPLNLLKLMNIQYSHHLLHVLIMLHYLLIMSKSTRIIMYGSIDEFLPEYKFGTSA